MPRSRYRRVIVISRLDFRFGTATPGNPTLREIHRTILSAVVPSVSGEPLSRSRARARTPSLIVRRTRIYVRGPPPPPFLLLTDILYSESNDTVVAAEHLRALRVLDFSRLYSRRGLAAVVVVRDICRADIRGDKTSSSGSCGPQIAEQTSVAGATHRRVCVTRIAIMRKTCRNHIFIYILTLLARYICV